VQYTEQRENGDVPCGKAVAAMWVFPQIYTAVQENIGACPVGLFLSFYLLQIKKNTPDVKR
jgi:hypothetical protein